MARAAASLAEARSHNVPPDVFLKFYREIRGLKDEQAEAAAAVARAKKAAKAAGIDMDAFKWLEKLANLDDDEAEMQIKHLQTYAQWLKLPIGSQLDMFGKPEPEQVDAAAAAEQAEWEAGTAGHKAGAAGHQREDNPYDAGSVEFVAWDTAWMAGYAGWMKVQKSLAADLGANAGQPRKRGRPANGVSAGTH